MPRPRFQNVEAKFRETLLRAAAAEFAAHGYEGASVNRIIESANLSKGAFYYYFDDKADLAATVLEQVYVELIAPLRQLREPESVTDFWREFDLLLRETLASLQRNPQQTELVTRLGAALARNAHLAKHLQPMIATATETVARLWRRGQELGAVRADLQVPVLLALLQGVKLSLVKAMLPSDRSPTPEELERVALLQADVFRRICAPTPPVVAGAAPTQP